MVNNAQVNLWPPFKRSGTDITQRTSGDDVSLNNGVLKWSAGKAVTATDYVITRNADTPNYLQFNIPTGASYEFSVNDVQQLLFNTNGAIWTTLIEGNQTSSYRIIPNNKASTLPIYTFRDDTNTGFGSSGADTLLLITNGHDNITLSDTAITLQRSAGATAAGTDSISVNLAGQTSAATRNITLLNEADVGTDTYRLRINNSSGTQLFTLDEVGLATHTLAATGKVYIDGTTTAQTNTAGALDIDVTSLTANVTSLNIASINTAVTGNTAYGIYNTMTSTAVVTGTAQNLYGLYNSVTKTGLDTSVDITRLYGVYGAASNTGSTNAGTKVTYGGYFSSTGDANGTSTTYGIYAVATGADTNWAGYFTGNVGSTGQVYADTFSSLGANAVTIKGYTADGATADNVIIDSANTFSTSGANLVSIRNNTSEKAYFTKDGDLYILDAGTGVYTYRVLSRAGSLGVLGQVADGAAAIGIKFANTAALSTAGAKIASFYSDNLTTEVAYINYLGSFNAGAGTALLPAYSFLGDPNSGFYSIGADNIGLALGGAIEVNFTTTAVSPGANDGSALGTTLLMWSDLFLANGGVINWNNGEYTITEGTTGLTAAGNYTNNAGQINFLNLTPIYNQTGTAATADIYINRTETALGSGTHYFVDFAVSDSLKFGVTNKGSVTINQTAVTGTNQSIMTLTSGAHTSLTASTIANSIYWNLGATKTWATGDITAQEEIVIDSPTYAFDAASTITFSSLMTLGRPPRAGTNATINFGTTLALGGQTPTANAIMSSHLAIAPLGIRIGYGAMTTLAGIDYFYNGVPTVLGNQTATLTNLNAIRLEAITYTSTTNVRTVTNPVKLYVEADTASTNVTFTNPAMAASFVGGVGINGYSAISMGATGTAGVVLTVGANNTTMPAATTAWRDLQVGGNITELANATITDIVGAYFNTFTITDGAGTETVAQVSTVYIAGAPTIGTTPTKGPYALFVDAGEVRIDGSLGDTTDRVLSGFFTDLTVTNAIAGSITGNAATITVADTTDTTCYVGLFEDASGSLGAKTDAGLTYNANTGFLTATGLVTTDLNIGGATIETGSTATLNIKNGTAPTALVADQIQVYSADTSDNTATLALFLEQAIEDIGTFTGSHKVKIFINGTAYWLELDAVA